MVLAWVLDVVVSPGQAFWPPFVGRPGISHQRTLAKYECRLMCYIVEHLFRALGPEAPLWGQISFLGCPYRRRGQQSTCSGGSKLNSSSWY